MQRAVAVLALGAVLWTARPLPAAETPHLDFIRGLRSRQYLDLAQEYAEKLLPTAPSAQAPFLLLELAKIKFDLADEEMELTKRPKMYAAARERFEEFLKKYPSHPLESDARLEIARVANAQGRTQLRLALREFGAERTRMADTARKMLVDAGKQLESVAGQIQKDLDTRYKDEPKTPDERAAKQALEQAMQQAVFDQATNLLDQAKTYVNEGSTEVLKERAKIVGKAEELLDKVGSGEARNPLTWKAKAYRGLSMFEGGTPADARKVLEGIVDERAAAAEEGKRLARYFLMRVVREAANPKEDVLRTIQKLGEDWLRLYGRYRERPEGMGVQYLLAEVFLEQAASTKNAFQQRPLLQKSLALFKEVEKTENEFSDKAREKKIQIIFTRQGGDQLKVAIDRLPTFDDCFVRAQYEFVQMAKEAKEEKDPEELKKKQDEHNKNVVQALMRALDLVAKGAKVNPTEVRDARVMLAYTHLTMGNQADAARVGDAAARMRPPSSAASRAGLYALQAYSMLPDETAKLHDLAEYMEKTWPDEMAGDMARHQLALGLIRDEKYPEAVEKLGNIQPEYGNFVFSQYQLAMAALKADELGLKPAGPDKRPYADQALAALQKIPPLADDAEPSTAQTYIYARMQECTLLYKKDQFEQIEKIVKPVLEKLDGWKLPPDQQEQCMNGLSGLLLYAQYGKVEREYSAGNYEKVLGLMTPIVEALKADKLPGASANPRLQQSLLNLGLRANVQMGKTDKALEILKFMQDAGSRQGGLVDSTTILLSLVSSLKSQVDDLRKKGPSAKKQLDSTMSSFEAFMDELAKQEKLTPEIRLFLAHSYSTLDKYTKASNLLKDLQEPKGKDGNPPEPKAVQGYRTGRLLYARMLRLAKDFTKSDEVLKQISQESWGKNNFEVSKEKVHLLQSQGKYGGQDGAVIGWNTLLTQLRPRVGTDPRAKEEYWECYYFLTYSSYKYAQSLPDEKRKKDWLQRAAGFILKLEKSQPDMGGEASKRRFDELLETEPPLRQEYEAMKKTAS